MKASFFIICFPLIFFSYCGNQGKDTTNDQPSIKTNQINRIKKRLIEKIHFDSDLPYKWSLLDWGTKMYIDRDYIYTSIPSELKRHLVLCPANNDKFSDPESGSPLISFQVKEDVRIYIIYTNLYTQLEQLWLNESNGWKNENFLVDTTLWLYKSNRLVRSKIFLKGSSVELSGNGCMIDNCDMYTVVIAPVNKQNQIIY